MRKTTLLVVLVGALLLAGTWCQAADEKAAAPKPSSTPLLDGLKQACNTELTTFCKGVKPGEGRILACLYAFEDQVSDKCIYALYDAAAQLEQAVTALEYAAKQCKGDLQKFCADVKLGEGRGLACLQKNDKDVSQGCKDALKQTGIAK